MRSGKITKEQFFLQLLISCPVMVQIISSCFILYDFTCLSPKVKTPHIVLKRYSQ